MAKLTWGAPGTRTYETGVDHGVLYLADMSGVPWNGLVSVSESPSGAEASPQYADNIKYLNLVSAEEFGATIEAFTYPEEFEACDGTASPRRGVTIGQQRRKSFGMSYRTKIGNDLFGNDYGYKIHLIYNALAAPTEKAYATINESPEAITFSWELSTTPAEVSGHKPTATLSVDSTRTDPTKLLLLEEILYGTATKRPRLPSPDEVIALVGGNSNLFDIQSTTVAGFSPLVEDEDGVSDFIGDMAKGMFELRETTSLSETTTPGLFTLD